MRIRTGRTSVAQLRFQDAKLSEQDRADIEKFHQRVAQAGIARYVAVAQGVGSRRLSRLTVAAVR